MIALIIFLFFIISSCSNDDAVDTCALTMYAADFERELYSEKTDYCSKLPTVVDDQVIKALEQKDMDFYYKRDIALIALKYYKCQFRYHSVSHPFVLVDDTSFRNKILKAYRRVLGDEYREAVNAYDIFSWLKYNEHFLYDSHILDEIEQIKHLRKERGLESSWKLDIPVCSKTVPDRCPIHTVAPFIPPSDEEVEEAFMRIYGIVPSTPSKQ